MCQNSDKAGETKQHLVHVNTANGMKKITDVLAFGRQPKKIPANYFLARSNMCKKYKADSVSLFPGEVMYSMSTLHTCSQM